MTARADSNVPTIGLGIVGGLILAELISLWFLENRWTRMGLGLALLVTGALAARVIRIYRNQQRRRREIAKAARRQ